MPKHVVSIVPQHTRWQQDPYVVNFSVPLSFNKFDLRDYLHNLYGVNALKVRSWVILSGLSRKEIGAGQWGRWYRPAAKKYMAVRLNDPFVLPEKPVDTKPWDSDLHEVLERYSVVRNRVRERFTITGDNRKNKVLRLADGKVLPEPEEPFIGHLAKFQRKAANKEASELLAGEKKWENGVELDLKWQAKAKELKARKENLGKSLYSAP